jgi:DNA-binding transcriptional MerR regulator
MAYTKQDVMARSGLPDRTIRNYIKRGLLPRPVGHGLAAEYDEDHMVRAVAIGRFRADGIHMDAIADQIAGWKTSQFKRFVAKTDPKQPDEPAPASPPAQSASAPVASAPAAPARAPAPTHSDEALLGEPVERAPLRTPKGHEAIAQAALPEAPRWRIYSLLSGMALMVDDSAAPVVQRIAAEILAKYGGD